MYFQIDEDYFNQNEKKEEPFSEKLYNGTIFLFDSKNWEDGYLISFSSNNKYYIHDLEVHSVWSIKRMCIEFAVFIENQIDSEVTGISSCYIETDMRSKYPMMYGVSINCFENSILDHEDELIEIVKNKFDDHFNSTSEKNVTFIQMEKVKVDRSTGKFSTEFVCKMKI